MADKETLALDLTQLAAGRVPRFTDQPAVDVGALDGIPSGQSPGVDVADAIVSLISLRLRRDASTHRTIFAVTVLDDTETYTITLGGTPFVYGASGGDTEEVILEGLRALIDVDVAYNAPVGAVTGTGADARLEVTGVAQAIYTSLAVGSGSADMSVVPDAALVTWRLWGLPKNQPTGVEAWFRVPLEGPSALNEEDLTTDVNWCEEARVSGYSRIFVEITATDGRVTPSIGPAGAETLL